MTWWSHPAVFTDTARYSCFPKLIVVRVKQMLGECILWISWLGSSLLHSHLLQFPVLQCVSVGGHFTVTGLGFFFGFFFTLTAYFTVRQTLSYTGCYIQPVCIISCQFQILVSLVILYLFITLKTVLFSVQQREVLDMKFMLLNWFLLGLTFRPSITKSTFFVLFLLQKKSADNKHYKSSSHYISRAGVEVLDSV